MNSNQLILLTGASGYVGGHLLKALQKSGCRVRCLSRHPEALEGHASPRTEVMQGDCLVRDTLKPALKNVDTAYYLVHSMANPGSFEEQDRQAAKNFAQEANNAGINKITYLGGLGEGTLSAHLRSRQEIGEILRSYGGQVIEFRASIVIGSGSLSFEMIRALVERLPVMICPRWVSVKSQPIAIDDLIAYLFEALRFSNKESRIYEIGGPDQVSYGEMMKEYARQRGLRRLLISVPVLTPRLSSLWLGLVTPLYARVGKRLIESIKNPTVVRDPTALSHFSVRPMGLRKSINQALANEDQEFSNIRWADYINSQRFQRSWGGIRVGNKIVDSREVTVPALPEVAFRPIHRIGGNTGWYYANWLWKLRGFLDQTAGGVGLRRGRPDPEVLSVGSTLDFWRVQELEMNGRLLLRAEMKLPGRAWLDFQVDAKGQSSIIRQTAIYDPKGLSGLTYWYLLYPIHSMVFSGMLREIAKACRQETKEAQSP